MLTFITIPIAPMELNTDADTSLIAVLDYGLRHGLYSGSDLVHVYGLLGHLVFYYFAPHSAWIRLVTDLALGYTVAAGLCLVASRLRWPAACLLLGLFIFIAPNVYPRGDLIIDTGLFCWGLLCCVESGRRLWWNAVVLIGFAVFSALAKNSFLLTNGCSLLLVSLLVAANGAWRVGLGIVAGFAAGVFSVWLALGPGLKRLPETVSNAFAIVRAYNETVGWDTLSLTLIVGLLVVALTTLMIVLRSTSAFKPTEKAHVLRRALLLAWLLGILFIEWKHGFVRGDLWHVGYFFGFVPVLALGLEILPTASPGAMRWSRVLATVCCAACLFALQLTYFAPPSQSLAEPFLSFFRHTRDVFAPRAYQRRMNDAIEEARKNAALPEIRRIVGNASMDVFGHFQYYALLNGLNYHPRPVFQSHAACSARLAALNEQFFLSTNAPAYLMFVLAPIDRRFPTLEDPMLLRDLLFNFESVVTEGPFLLLKAREPAPTRMTLLREGEARPGEKIELKDFGDTNLWMEIDLKLSPVGRIRQFLYHPPTVRLAAWRDGGGRLLLRRRAPPPMLAAGFIASPLLSRNEDLAAFHRGESVARPTAYSVEIMAGEDYLWDSSFHFRLYKLEKGTAPLPPRN